MGVEPPFLYEQPSRQSLNDSNGRVYNPRAATISSWGSPPKTMAKIESSMNNNNRHPDSWYSMSDTSRNAKAMRPSTKSWIKRLRRFQLFLRSLELVGTLGMLFCVIVINGTSGSAAWIIRVAPAVGVLHTIYAIQHLCRNVTRKTPASSASFHWFAAIIDPGLVAFLSFTAILCQEQYTSDTFGWGTMFAKKEITYDIVFAAFIASASLGGLYLVSFLVDVWLAIIFRKISRLPADMNPLEDNLTARPHKRNKSEFTIEDKQGSQLSLPSTITNGRSEANDSLISPPRRVPFTHSRNGSSENLMAYHQTIDSRGSYQDLRIMNRQPYQNPNSSFHAPRMDVSPAHAAFYQQQNQSRGSQINLDRPSSSRSTPPRPGSAPNRPGQGQYRPNKPSQLKDEYHHPLSSPYGPINDENREPTWPLLIQDEQPPKPPAHEAVDIRDWYSPPRDRRGIHPLTKNDYLAVPTQESHHHQQQPPLKNRKSNLAYDFDRDLKTPKPQQGAMSPLSMNPPSPSVYSPPSPPLSSSPRPQEPRRVALADADVNLPDNISTADTSTPTAPPHGKSSDGPNRASSFIGSGTKSKYYGEVMNFSRGPTISREKSGRSDKSDQSSRVNGGADSMSIYSTSDRGGLGDMDTSTIVDIDDGKGRVISNSSYDLNGGYAGLGPEFGKGMASRRRDVSGKVAEEGRGDGGLDHGHNTTTSPRAAGWARFQGL